MKVLGHEKDLDINHENCIANINENWYLLGNYNPNELIYFGHHFPQNINIKYHIHNQAMKSEYTWTDDISLEIANNIQMSFVNSILLWNNVYYYSYDETNVRMDITQTYSISSSVPCSLNLTATNCPYPMLQYYNIIVITPNAKATVDSYGRVTVNGEETIQVRCQYKLNIKYDVYITLIIT